MLTLCSFAAEPGRVTVESAWSAESLQLAFTWADLAAPLHLPMPAAMPQRRDGLWQASCAELFVGLGGSEYLEFNFSPSGDWAAYRFDAPRRGMRAHEWAGESSPQISTQQHGAQHCRVLVELPRAALTVDGVEVSARDHAVGYASVIETSVGFSYWALAHYAAQPDFHDRRSFSARLGNPS